MGECDEELFAGLAGGEDTSLAGDLEGDFSEDFFPCFIISWGSSNPTEKSVFFLAGDLNFCYP